MAMSALYPLIVKACSRPRLLKKSSLVSAAEKYAFGIEIFIFGKGFLTQISRRCVQKGVFLLVNDQAVLDDRVLQQNRRKPSFP